MTYKTVLVLLQASVIYGAPLQEPLLQQFPQPLLQPFQTQPSSLSQQLALEQQLLALQQFQDLRRNNGLNPFFSMNTPQPLPPPIVVLLAQTDPSEEYNDQHSKGNGNQDTLKNRPPQGEEENEDLDSVVIEAPQNENTSQIPQIRALMLMPNDGRFGIGGLISAIPFFPIEVNVPDTISWVWNGISSIISGIGNRFPFRPFRPQQATSTAQGSGTKFLLKNFQPKFQSSMNMPIIILPVNVPSMVPVPMQF